MRKDWIRTDEERELRKIRNIQKQQRKLNKSSSNEQPVIDLPIVIRKKKRIVQAISKPVSQELVVRRTEPVNHEKSNDLIIRYVFLDFSNSSIWYSSKSFRK
jgi:hypothetical protein